MFTSRDFGMSPCVALLATLFLCPPAHSAAELDRAALMSLSVSLVKVEAADAEGRAWIGTGVIVGPERVVTSCHVTRRGESVYIQYHAARQLASAQSADTEHDLCLLVVPGLVALPARLGAAGALAVGQPVWALGYEGGFALQARAGVVRALHAYDGGYVVESTTAFTSGASGGALFDATGRLVAILTYRLRGDRRSYFSVPVEWFAPRLSSEHAYAAIGPLDGALAFWQRPQEGLPFFLRAHQLETGRDWTGLRSLADDWCKAESSNAEAWLFRGKSLAETQDVAAARSAFRHAVALDPLSSAAWLELGRLSVQDGSIEEAEDALFQLSHLNPELAHCLASELRPKQPLAQPENPALDACSAI